MIRSSRYFIGFATFATAIFVSSGAPEAQTATVKKPVAGKPAVQAVQPAQPQLVALNVEKCVGCQTTVRKRIGVMPVKVGAISAELGMSGVVVADKVRAALEARVAQSGNLLAVNRTDLGDVMAEQALANSGAANPDLRIKSGAVIPAQLLLYATVNKADVSVRSEKQSNNTAADYHRQALAKEQQAAAAQSRARQAQAEFERTSMKTDWESNVSKFGSMVDDITDCSRQPAPLVQICESRKRMNEKNREDAARRKREIALKSGHEEVSRYQDEAARLQSEADFLRRKADMESRRDVTETRTTSLDVAFTWRAIDTATGAVVASGQSGASRSQTDKAQTSQGAYQGSETISSTRHDALVNAALDEAMQTVARDLDGKLALVPFRAKVVKTDADGIYINAGTNLGVAVGDTFGVREKADVLTDPDTGELLSTPGKPVGYIRVVEVFEKTARAQIVKQAVSVKRGDELEWIGMFMPAGSR